LQAATVEGQYEDWAAALSQTFSTGQPCRFENVSCKTPEGGELLANITCRPLKDPANGTVTGGVLVWEDVTLQGTMERRLAVSERLAAVGKLAARVAHELNNPLDGILRYINMAIRVTEKDGDERTVRYLTESRKGLMRMTQIIRELLEFSRASHGTFGQTTINQLVEDAVKAMTDQATKNRVTIVLSLEAQVPGVRADNLFQVFCNLTKNALDAMPDGGTLTISTKASDPHVVIRFKDTGAGLPDDVDKIFEPFFTTKEPGKGTGLGLAVSRDIIERYNGRLIAESPSTGGAIFEVRMPLSSCAASEGRGF
jgi:signal transduction histidine kinase